ncbi:RNA polymerase sigma factor [Geoanaerobacter pelophilus]|uniref:RNA polymerase sigma factor n=1 Tax=Geoanaerobacter pelophilus TaxID=60036 RepID=UPI002484779E|nr:RNA polymerase sigma factor [Geoanaerobacter pelophilus]
MNCFLAEVERRAFRMAYLATGCQDDALDVVQDAMLDFVRRYATRPAEEWRPLFYRINQNRITDWHRRTTVRNRFRSWFGMGHDDGDDGFDPVEAFADPRGETPASELLNRELGQQLEKSVRQLPLRQQQAFLLRAWEGLDVAQTAVAMKCSEGSVKTHYFRAVNALRNVLEEYR